MTEENAWQLLLGLAARAKAGNALETKCAVGVDEGGLLLEPSQALFLADPAAERSWSELAGAPPLAAGVRCLLDLYMPLCVGAAASHLVVAHLGQSLDGRIATHTGASQFITGEANLLHAHRMRALFDAVVVGANTASTDNPRLTTRLASGEHPTRVLIDPRCSVPPGASLFTDQVAPTIVICDPAHTPETNEHVHLGVATEDGLMPCESILEALRAQGLGRIFIEGGGLTVSQFLSARALHRLQVCVAPMILGSGRPAFQLPEVDELGDGIFLDCRHFSSGKDLLFDCQLRGRE